MRLGNPWIAEGIRQLQSFGIANVPRVVAAAAIDPTNQEALKMEVIKGRSFG